MIEFISRNDFELSDADIYRKWVSQVLESEGKQVGEITYFFCNDNHLDVINQQYLNHTDFTDIISFDYTHGDIISGDIMISTERVADNAVKYGVKFGRELLRVMAHGLLHYCGYNDKSDEETRQMRAKENEKIKMFHVEQF